MKLPKLLVWTYPATYIKNYDADTITLSVDVVPWLGMSMTTSVRLAGIDAPEMRGRCDEECILAELGKRFVEDCFFDAHEVLLTVTKLGKYGRPIGRISLDGQDLAEALLQEGLAVGYDGGKRLSWC